MAEPEGANSKRKDKHVDKHIQIFHAMGYLMTSKRRLQGLLEEVTGNMTEDVTACDTPPPVGLAEMLSSLASEINALADGIDKIREELHEALF